MEAISIADDQRHKLNNETPNTGAPETVQESLCTNNTRNADSTEPPSSKNLKTSTSTSTQVIIPSEDQEEESSSKDEVDSKDEEDLGHVHESALFIEAR